MRCPTDKHEIRLWISCELFERICEGARIAGRGQDLERYIISIITEHC